MLEVSPVVPVSSDPFKTESVESAITISKSGYAICNSSNLSSPHLLSGSTIEYVCSVALQTSPAAHATSVTVLFEQMSATFPTNEIVAVPFTAGVDKNVAFCASVKG